MTKNRDGKPTVFQLSVLRGLGCTQKPKTYREAENAIKRLRHAHAVKNASAATTKKPVAKTAAKQTACKKPCCGKTVAKKPTVNPCNCKFHKAAANKDKTDRKLPIIRNGYACERIALPKDAKFKAQLAVALGELTAMIEDLHNALFSRFD